MGNLPTTELDLETNNSSFTSDALFDYSIIDLSTFYITMILIMIAIHHILFTLMSSNLLNSMLENTLVTLLAPATGDKMIMISWT
jgi:hypothetical protein